jgi:hypothetical protein
LNKIKKILLVTALFAVASVSVSVSPTFAAPPTPAHKTGWGGGAGSDNGVQAGPGGVSVRSNDTINISNTFNVLAEGSAKVVINVTNVVYHTIFGK